MNKKRIRQCWYKVRCTGCNRKYKTFPKTFFEPLEFYDCHSCGQKVVRDKKMCRS